MKVYLPGVAMDLDSKFYKNCKKNRSRESLPQCCVDCPLRRNMDTIEELYGKMKKRKHER